MAGLPEPRRDHAVAMCKFANACMNKMNLITHRLEVELGPGTADLAMVSGYKNPIEIKFPLFNSNKSVSLCLRT